MRSLQRHVLGVSIASTFAFVSISGARADIQVFTDLAHFQAATGATAQPPLPNLGLVGRHVASATVGDLTFAINNGSPEIALFIGESIPLHPGNEIALSDWEALDVTSAFPVYSIGSYFIEGTDASSCSPICPCNDATYLVRLLMNSTVVGEFQINAPDNVLSFLGVSSTQPFNRVEYRDLSQQCDNEYWGQFFLNSELPCIQITQQPVNASTCPGSAAPFSVVASGAGPFSYQWQMETTPDTWINLGTQPSPLACGGNASHATATPENSPAPNIFAHGCPGPFNVRVIVSSPCGSVTSTIAVLSICAADFNCDRVLDFFDYLDFVGAFADNEQAADFNADDVIDFFDYLDFVDAFSHGC